MGILKEFSGVLFAKPGGDLPVERCGEYEEAILGVVAGEERPSDLSVVSRIDFGHTDPMFVLPHGVEAEVDCGEGRLAIVEGGLVDLREPDEMSEPPRGPGHRRIPSGTVTATLRRVHEQVCSGARVLCSMFR